MTTSNKARCRGSFESVHLLGGVDNPLTVQCEVGRVGKESKKGVGVVVLLSEMTTMEAKQVTITAST